MLELRVPADPVAAIPTTCTELSHVADQQVGHLVGSEVAAVVEHRPVDDVLVVALGESADAVKSPPNAAGSIGIVVGSGGGVACAFS
ncbi:MAG TPA: hypothetical protein VKA58_04295 [Propionibacteriaceae bacterium]|nr:hypothetical protein [Propionibacteriaceae bacterium]